MKIKSLVAGVALIAILGGCSPQTQQQVEETSKAVAADVKQGATEAVDATKEAAADAKEVAADKAEAAVEATRKMHRFLCERLNIENHEAGMLLSAAADLRICQIVDPLMTVRMEFPIEIANLYAFKAD